MYPSAHVYIKISYISWHNFLICSAQLDCACNFTNIHQCLVSGTSKLSSYFPYLCSFSVKLECICIHIRGGLKKLDKIKTLAESALPLPPQFRLRHFLYDFRILDLPPLQTRLSHSLYDFFLYCSYTPPIPHTHYLPYLYTQVSLVWP